MGKINPLVDVVGEFKTPPPGPPPLGTEGGENPRRRMRFSTDRTGSPTASLFVLLHLPECPTACSGDEWPEAQPPQGAALMQYQATPGPEIGRGPGRTPVTATT